MRDIDLIIEKVKQRIPDAEVHQLEKNNPSDDDGIWYFYIPGIESDIQIESS